jgi:hypothetical protein
MVAQTQKGVPLFAMFPFLETSFIPGYYGKKVRDRNKNQLF